MHCRSPTQPANQVVLNRNYGAATGLVAITFATDLVHAPHPGAGWHNVRPIMIG